MLARVHSGDPSLYGAIAEQIRRLQALDIPFEITPGVPAFAAAAATLGTELTVPEIAQTVILTRTAMKSSAMPEGEDLDFRGRLEAVGIGVLASNRQDRLKDQAAIRDGGVIVRTGDGSDSASTCQPSFPFADSMASNHLLS